MMRRFLLLLTLSALSIFAVACGGETVTVIGEANAPVEVETATEEVNETEAEVVQAVEESGGLALPAIDPLDVTGDIVAAGSSTVFPLAEAMIARFVDEGYPGNATYDSIGSGGGFERFCVNSESDISGSSRPIKDGEIEECRANGREPIEFRVGTDALAVVVSQSNDFVDDVTMEELAAIFSTATNWSDVRAEWPNEPILRYSPGTDSGTFDYFVEEVFDEDEGPILAGDPELSEDDNVLVQGVQGSPYAVAYFGYAYFNENADTLKALSVDGVAPAKENVDAATYPLARPLYVYSTADIMAEKPQVADFMNFFITYVNEEIEEVGYFAASGDDLSSAKSSWLAASSGEGMMEEEMDEMEGDSGSIMLPAIDALDVSGDIVAAGSSTVFPLAEAMIARFVDEGYPDNATYDSIGSGGGFERFCVNSESDISGASRKIKDSEVEDCRANGREPIEFRVGTDALAVVVSQSNDFVEDVTMEELAAIFSTAATWADVREGWPAEPILRYSPGTDSGTFDYFVEEVFDEDEGPILAGDPELSEDDNVLVQGVQGSPYAVAYFGYAYFNENADTLKAISIDGVAPIKENVDAATYPLARPLYLYSTATIMAEKPQVGQFINFFLTYVDEEIEDVGYFAGAESDLNSARTKWLDANK